jgi:PAS domain S-box-containing protein
MIMTDPLRHEGRLHAAVRAANVGLWEWDVNTTHVTYSPEWKRQLGYVDTEIGEEFSEWEERVHPDDLPRVKRKLAEYFADPGPHYEAEFRMRHKDGSWRWILAQAALMRDAEGRPLRFVGSHIDITDHKRTELELARVNRALRMLSASNHALVRLDNEEALLREVCRIVVEIGGYRMAWVGLAEPDARKTLRPVAQAGFEPGFLESTELTWGEAPHGHDPAAVAIRTHELCVARARAGDPAFAVWRDSVVQRGYRSAIALPLVAETKIVGALSIYSEDDAAFAEEEAKTLAELAGNVAFGVGAMRVRAERDRGRERFRVLTESSLTGIYLIQDGRFRYVNPAMAKIFGYSIEELAGKLGPLDLTDPQDRPVVVENMRRRLDGDASDIRYEFRGLRKDGSLIHVEVHGRRIDYGGQVGVIGTLIDVTARNEAVAKLHESEARFRTFVDHATDAVFLHDDRGTILDVNQQACESLGYTRAELIGLTPAQIDAESRSAEHERLRARLAAGESVAFDSHHRRKDGTVFPVEVRIRPFWEGGRRFGIALARDITDRKRAQEALTLFRSLIDRANDVIEVIDPETGRFVDVNEKAFTAHGYTREEYLSLTVADVDPRVKLQSWQASMAELKRTGNRVLESVHQRKDGSVFPVEVNVTYVRLDRDYVLAVVRDISERKQAETALQESREHLAALIQSVDGIVWEADATTFQFTFVSPQAVQILGYPIEQWLNEPNFWTEHLHPADRDRAVDTCVRATKECRDHGFQYRMIAADGREVWLHDGVTVVAEGDRPVKLRGIMVDITTSKRAEEALRESEQRFRQVTESIDEVFWLTDVEKQKMIYISPAYEKVWGQTCENLYARPQSWMEAVHVEDRERVRRAALTMQAEGAYDLEYRIVRPDRSVRWIHDRAFPIKDADGRVRRIAGVAEDFTSRHQLEQRYHHAQKMEAIGRLAGGIAHDFNNLLTVVQMQTSILLEEHRMDAHTEQGVRQIMDAATRAANLTRQLLTFSRQQVKQARAIDVGEIVTGTTKLLWRVLGEDISLETRFASGLPLVRADPGMIEQVLMNLVINARDAMPEGGRLVLALDVATLDADAKATHVMGQSGRFVRLSVTDTGVGIAPENLPRIFEPFFTTKEVGKGTGLGLATAFGIVQQHHGWIEVESKLGGGTTFHVFLPALDGTGEAMHVKPAPRPGGGIETVLLVEDEPAVRAATAVALRRGGYRVLEAGNATEALRSWDDSRGNVNLVVTDIIMPGGMSGMKLAAELTSRRAGLKIIYTSGYSGESIGRELKLDPGRNFLPKPYPVSELLAIVRQRLDEP